jgi:hypothetical protein
MEGRKGKEKRERVMTIEFLAKHVIEGTRYFFIKRLKEKRIMVSLLCV